MRQRFRDTKLRRLCRRRWCNSRCSSQVCLRDRRWSSRRWRWHRRCKGWRQHSSSANLWEDWLKGWWSWYLGLDVTFDSAAETAAAGACATQEGRHRGHADTTGWARLGLPIRHEVQKGAQWLHLWCIQESVSHDERGWVIKVWKPIQAVSDAEVHRSDLLRRIIGVFFRLDRHEVQIATVRVHHGAQVLESWRGSDAACRAGLHLAIVQEVDQGVRTSRTVDEGVPHQERRRIADVRQRHWRGAAAG